MKNLIKQLIKKNQKHGKIKDKRITTIDELNNRLITCNNDLIRKIYTMEK